MPSTALTSAEISLPSTADAARVRERIATLADTVDLVGLTDNHAGQPRMSPLAAVALAREQGVRTSSTCPAATAIAWRCSPRSWAPPPSGPRGSYASTVTRRGIPRVKDLKATSLIAAAKRWAEPHELEVGAVVNPFAPDLDRELPCWSEARGRRGFVQSQMIFDLGRCVRS